MHSAANMRMMASPFVIVSASDENSYFRCPQTSLIAPPTVRALVANTMSPFVSNTLAPSTFAFADKASPVNPPNTNMVDRFPP